MDEPQKDLIEQIISASLARQSAAQKKEAGERDGTPGPAGPPQENGPPRSSQPPTPRSSAPPPKASRGLVRLTAALAVASAVLLAVCLAQLRAQREAADGLRETVEAVESVDGLREEREQLREETARLQQEMEQLQWYRENQERLTNSAKAQAEAETQTADALWTVLLARELFNAGEYENCALILQGLARSGQQEVNRTSYIDGEVRDVKSILDGMAAELEEMGYLSQEDVRQIGDKFALIKYY